MEPFSVDAVRVAYDTVAADYAEAFGDDLAELPLDREMLDAALDVAPVGGWVLEAGCGPAPAASYLAGRIRSLLGIDVSGAMLAIARHRNPRLVTAHADIRQLPLRAGCCSLVIAFYTLQHLPREDLGVAVAEFRRVLRAEGHLVLASHLGEGDVVLDEFLGHRVPSFGGTFHRRDELVDLLVSNGFRVRLERSRGPLPHEYDSRRIYLLAGLDA